MMQNHIKLPIITPMIGSVMRPQRFGFQELPDDRWSAGAGKHQQNTEDEDAVLSRAPPPLATLLSLRTSVLSAEPCLTRSSLEDISISHLILQTGPHSW